MKCEEIRKLLLDYCAGEMDARARKLVEEHLKSCPDCAAELAGWREYREKLGSLEAVKPPPDFLTRVHARLEKESGFKTALRRVFSPVRLKIPLEAAAAAAVVILVVYILNIPSGEISVKKPAPPAPPGIRIDAAAPAKRAGTEEAVFYRRKEEEAAAGSLDRSAPSLRRQPVAAEIAAAVAPLLDEAGPPGEERVELVLLVETETGFGEAAEVSRLRMKALQARDEEIPARKAEENETRSPSPLVRLKDLIAREGGEIVSTEKRPDRSRRLVITIPPGRYSTFREELARISDLGPAGADKTRETLRFRLTDE